MDRYAKAQEATQPPVDISADPCQDDWGNRLHGSSTAEDEASRSTVTQNGLTYDMIPRATPNRAQALGQCTQGAHQAENPARVITENPGLIRDGFDLVVIERLVCRVGVLLLATGCKVRRSRVRRSV